MNEAATPQYYDDLDLSFDHAWAMIRDGASNRRSPCHMPVVATTDQLGAPHMRIMVLRHACHNSRKLRFHTDIRSTKIEQIGNQSASSVLFYDPAAKVQIRLSGHARIVQSGAEADAAWEQSTPFARRCYMAEAGPGSQLSGPSSGLPDWIEGRQPDEGQLTSARDNFAILLFEARHVEWLYLANSGHRRARWSWDDNNSLWNGGWFVP